MHSKRHYCHQLQRLAVVGCARRVWTAEDALQSLEAVSAMGVFAWIMKGMACDVITNDRLSTGNLVISAFRSRCPPSPESTAQASMRIVPPLGCR